MKNFLPMTIVMCLLLAAGQVYAKPPGNKPAGGSGGGGKGGFGDLGDGCVTFMSPSGPGTVSDDGGGPYCNGTDGQVSVPVHLRLDTKKFNSGDRNFGVWGNCIGAGDATDDLCVAGVEGLMLNVTVLDGIGDDGNWTEMEPGEVADARMGIKIDNSHFLYFGPGACDGGSEPIHVRCDDDKNGDTFCDRWSISTDPGFPISASGFDSASTACYKSGAYGSYYNDDVEANFTMEVCVMGVSCD